MGSTLNTYYYSTQMDREYLEAQLISFLGEEVWSNLMSRMEDSMNPSGSSWFFLNRQYLEMQLVSMLGGEMWSQLMSRVENTMTKPQSYWFLFNLLSRWLSAYKLGKSIVHQNNKQEENEDKEKVEAKNDTEQNDGDSDSDSAVSLDETDLDSENNFEIHDDLHSKNFEVSNTEVLNVNEVEVVNGECNQNYMNDIILEEAEIDVENDNEDKYETCFDGNTADKIIGECFKEDLDKTTTAIILKDESDYINYVSNQNSEMEIMNDIVEVSHDIPSKELEITDQKLNAEHTDNDMDDNEELMADRNEITNKSLQENHLEENHFNISDSKQNNDSFDDINHDLYDSTESKELLMSVNEINFKENETPIVESHESHIEENSSGIFYSRQNSDSESNFENQIVLDAKQIDSSKELQISENEASSDNYATPREMFEECTVEENNDEMYNSKQNAITDIDMIYDLDIKEMDNDVPSKTVEVTGFEQCSEVSINDDIQNDVCQDDSNNPLIDSENGMKDDYSKQNKQFENVECSKTINVENDFDMDDKVSINEFEDYHINTKTMDTDVSTSTNLCDQFEEIYENNYLNTEVAKENNEHQVYEEKEVEENVESYEDCCNIEIADSEHVYAATSINTLETENDIVIKVETYENIETGNKLSKNSHPCAEAFGSLDSNHMTEGNTANKNLLNVDQDVKLRSRPGVVARRRSIFEIEDQDKLKEVETRENTTDTIVILTNAEKKDLDKQTNLEKNENNVKSEDVVSYGAGMVAKRRSFFETQN